MSRDRSLSVPTIALVVACALAIVALWALSTGRYMLAGTSFLFVSFALYAREQQK